MNLNLPFLPGKNPFDIHCYFEPDKAEVATALKDRLCARFDWLEQGRFTKSAGAVSPHPLPMFELFGGEPNSIAKVNEVIEWLRENRSGLSVLVHPNTTDGNYLDHSAHAVWLGEPVAVRLWVFQAQTAIKFAIVLGSAAAIMRSWL